VILATWHEQGSDLHDAQCHLSQGIVDGYPSDGIEEPLSASLIVGPGHMTFNLLDAANEG